MKYRPEVDGLRAIAVVPVILFHAGFKVFSGGFVGVDVFFVISGYLITTIILEDLKKDRFSIINFYERRARRILPALFFMMSVSIVLGWLWLMPNDMEGFAKSIIAVSIFISNILFWSESGYFDAAVELKPLLHTWSLAVEEQYYVIFPVFLFLVWRFGKRWLLASLVVIGVVSFILAQWGSVAMPVANFYLLPSRGWELLIGAVAAVYHSRENRLEINRIIREIGGVFGLLMILYSVFMYDQKVPYPGFYALAPTVGTVLIILFSDNGTYIGKFIANRLFVGIGLISYSAYLWHQPLFAFARYNEVHDDNKLIFSLLAVLSIIMAYVSWRFIEKPFRDKERFGRNKIFLYSTVGGLIFIVFGVAGIIKKGDLGRLNAEQVEFLTYFENDIPEQHYVIKMGLDEKYRQQCSFYDLGFRRRNGYETKIPKKAIATECYTSTKSRDKLVFIWGDSHAQQLYYGLKQTLPDDYDILQVASSGCVAKIETRENKNNYCVYSNWFAFQKIKEIRPGTVVIGQYMGHSIKNMKELSDALLAVGVDKVIFTGPTPHWTSTLPTVIAMKYLKNTPRRTFAGVDRGVCEQDKELKKGFFISPHVSYVSMIDYFGNDDGFLIYYGEDVKKGITTWDTGHLTPIASYHFAKDVLSGYILR